jgi:ring-1,2-phenylacetyl-CoA epoxidase subunit PaaD
MVNRAAAWAALETVLDPEVPVLSVVELGIVRELQLDGDIARVTVTPTYSGCPATEVINEAIVAALKGAGARAVEVRTRLAPPWTTDWIGPEAAEKLRRYGIAPPHLAQAGQTLRFHPRDLACPRCGSTRTERLSAFGATACKALHRCLDCREPFEHFKAI